MALLQLLFDLADDPLQDEFGYGLYPEQFIRPTLSRQSNVTAANLWPRLNAWSWLHRNRRARRAAALNKSNIGKDGFEVSMDVQHFQPHELTVKIVNNTVVIEAKHEETEDEFGEIYRHFIRRYELSDEIEIDELVSTLSSDSVLSIKAPLKIKSIDANERLIEIKQTGPAHLSVTPNPF